MPSSKKQSEKTEPKNNNNDNPPQRLYRSDSDKVVAGVAGGLGEYFQIDSTIIRILFILLTIFGGSGVLIYIVLWLVMPSKSSSNGLTTQTIRSNLEDMKSTTRTFAHTISAPKNDNKENSKFWWAIILIGIGFTFLLNNYGVLAPMELERLWPVVLILFGLAIILRK